ncbi:hypothetical protein CR513_59612, partial [Mucuna pruriens]
MIVTYVKYGFLNSILEEVYIEQPIRYVVRGKKDNIYIFNKALYELKQEPIVVIQQNDKYACDVLKKFKIESLKSISMLVKEKLKLTKESEDKRSLELVCLVDSWRSLMFAICKELREFFIISNLIQYTNSDWIRVVETRKNMSRNNHLLYSEQLLKQNIYSKNQLCYISSMTKKNSKNDGQKNKIFSEKNILRQHIFHCIE